MQTHIKTLSVSGKWKQAQGSHWFCNMVSCIIISLYNYNVIIIEIKCTINVMHLNHPKTVLPTTPGLWKNCLPWNQSLVPKRLETTALDLLYGIYAFCLPHALSHQSRRLKSLAFAKQTKKQTKLALCLFTSQFSSFQLISGLCGFITFVPVQCCIQNYF